MDIANFIQAAILAIDLLEVADIQITFPIIIGTNLRRGTIRENTERNVAVDEKENMVRSRLITMVALQPPTIMQDPFQPRSIWQEQIHMTAVQIDMYHHTIMTDSTVKGRSPLPIVERDARIHKRGLLKTKEEKGYHYLRSQGSYYLPLQRQFKSHHAIFVIQLNVLAASAVVLADITHIHLPIVRMNKIYKLSEEQVLQLPKRSWKE